MIFKPNYLRINMALRWYCSKTVESKKQTIQERVAAMSPQELVRNMVKVSDWNKRLLVFSGRYKNMKDIPDYLPFGTVDKERNRVRVKVANYMMVAAAIGFILTIWSGKKAAEAGDSVEKRITDWHKEYNENARREEAEAAAAAAKKTA